jgi:hypothetical protein
MSLKARVQRLEGGGSKFDRIVVLRPHQSVDDVKERFPEERILIVHTGISRAPNDPLPGEAE